MAVSTLSKGELITQGLEKDVVRESVYGNGKLQSIRMLAKRFGATPATVCKAVDELSRRGLIEKQHGRGLFVGKSCVNNSVAFVSEQRFFTPQSGWYCPVLLSELEAAFKKRNMGVHYFLNITSRFCEQNFDFLLGQKKFSAVVFVSQWFFENKRSQVEARKIPCIGVFRNGDLKHWVTVDIKPILSSGFEELKKMKRKKIALVCVKPEADWNEYGKQNHREWRLLADEIVGSDMVVEIPSSSQAGFDTMKQLWREKRPDAVMVTEESLGRGVVAAAMSLGLKIPEDVVIVSEVIEGGGKMLGVPVIEIRTPVRDQASAIVEMVSLICSGQKIAMPQLFVKHSIMNPFVDY